MAPDNSEYNKPLNIHINTPIPTTSKPTILGLTFDPKLNFPTHTNNTIAKTQKTLHINTLRQKPGNTTTYNTLLLPIIEYANTIWSPISLKKTTQNSKRSPENNHGLHPRHQHSTLPLLTSRLTTHTKSLTRHLPLHTHYTISSSQLQKKIHIQQLSSKHTLLPENLSHTNKKQYENHRNKNNS